MGKTKKHKQHLIAQEVVDEVHTALMAVDTENTDVLYLADEDAGDAVILVLAPPDLVRCQCEWRDTHLETFGPKPVHRCDEAPTVVAFQKRTRDDASPTGAMSLCADHHILIEHMYPGQCYFRRITSDQTIGEIV